MADLIQIEFELTVVVVIAELFTGGKQIQSFSGIVSCLSVFIVGTPPALADIYDITFAVMVSRKLGAAVRAVKTTGASGYDFISEGLMTDFTGILIAAVVQVEILVGSSAVRAGPFIVEIRTMSDRPDQFGFGNILKTYLYMIGSL